MTSSTNACAELLTETAKAALITALSGHGYNVVADVAEATSGDVVLWGDHPHRVGICPEGTRCFSCDRLGKHLEPMSKFLGTPRWLEAWEAGGNCVIAVFGEGPHQGRGYATRAEVSIKEYRELIAGVPFYIQALLDAEVSKTYEFGSEARERVCGVCQSETAPTSRIHGQPCSIDIALTAAGLKTPAQRNGARALLAAWRTERALAIERTEAATRAGGV